MRELDGPVVAHEMLALGERMLRGRPCERAQAPAAAAAVDQPEEGRASEVQREQPASAEVIDLTGL